MNVRLLEPGVLCAFLPREPEAQSELGRLWKELREKEPLHVIIDLSRVEVLTSPSIGTMLLIRKLQCERGARLLLCNLHLPTRCILRVVGLDTVFDYTPDKPDALRILRALPPLQRPDASAEPLADDDHRPQRSLTTSEQDPEPLSTVDCM